MGLQSSPSAVRTTAGNGEERTAQIERIQERLDRLRQFSQRIAIEVVAMTLEMAKLNDPPPPSTPLPTKEPTSGCQPLSYCLSSSTVTTSQCHAR